jgi:hypothetical protein
MIPKIRWQEDFVLQNVGLIIPMSVPQFPLNALNVERKKPSIKTRSSRKISVRNLARQLISTKYITKGKNNHIN